MSFHLIKSVWVWCGLSEGIWENSLTSFANCVFHSSTAPVMSWQAGIIMLSSMRNRHA